MNNYEINKLVVQNPDLANILIFFLLFCACIASLRKKEVAFMDTIATDQLKGIAILFVIVGHLWVHVAEKKPAVVLSGEAVALFLLLSGFGLYSSFQNKPTNLKVFFKRRVSRVFVPYWFSTLIIICMDRIFLDRSYSLQNLFYTFLGININSVTQHIDYVRWYITFLLFWYITFPFVFKCFKSKYRLLAFLSLSFMLFPFDYYISQFGWRHIFAFPVGCVFAHYHLSIRSMYHRNANKFLFNCFFVILVVGIYKLFLTEILIDTTPFIVFKLVQEGMSCMLAIALIFVIAYLGLKQYHSKFLIILGGCSYELFLLHGAFLIKYNPIVSSTKYVGLIVQFIILLVLLTLLSVAFQKSVRMVS